MNGGSAVATSFPLYICLKFASGFFMSGYILANFVLLNELIGASKRGLIGVATQAFFAGGIIAFSIMANYIRHWRQLTGASTAIAVPLIVLSHWILPESPRWLQNKGKIKEAIDVLKLIAFHNSSKWNDRLVNEDEESETDEDIEDFGEQRITINPNMRSSGQPQHNNDCTVNEDGLLLTDSVMDLFKHKFLTKLTLIQLYSWFVNGVSYYGLTLAAGSTNKRDLYMGTALSGAVEFPAYALSIFLLAYMGRTTTISAFMIIGGVSMLSIPICAPFLPFISTSLSLLGKLCISSSFAMIYIHSNEIFPTTIRNSGMGLVSVAARIGGIMAPYVSRLGNVFPNLHFILFGLLALTSGLCTIMLPDTKDQPLPETLNDLMSRRYRIVSVQSPNVSYKKVPSNEM
jgi:MFS family permease